MDTSSLGGGDRSFLVSQEEPRRAKYWIASLGAWMSALAAGASLGYTAPAIPSMGLPTSHIHITEEEATWFGSFLAIFALIGSLVGGFCIGTIGRKGTLLLVTIPFIGGWLCIAYARTFLLLLVGRALTGLACGMITISAPTYIGETTPSSVRGFFGAGFQLSAAIGVLLVYLAGKYLAWSWLAVNCALYPLLALLIFTVAPESPQWLISQGRISDATDAMLFLYGNDPARLSSIQDEQPSIVQPYTDLEDSSRGMAASTSYSMTTTMRLLSERHNLIPTLMVMAVMIIQQFVGINAIIFYTVSIFRDTGSHIDAHDATINIGAVQVITTVVACGLIDRAGRRGMFLVSLVLMAASLGALSLFYLLKAERGDQFAHDHGWLPLLSLVVYVMAYSLGAGPLPWLLMSEMVPSAVKGVASAMASCTNWLGAFIVTKEFHALSDLLTEQGVFLGFALVSVLGGLFVAVYLPETKGKSHAEIEQHFRGLSATSGTNGGILTTSTEVIIGRSDSTSIPHQSL